jgi:hypothetical protein
VRTASLLDLKSMATPDRVEDLVLPAAAIGILLYRAEWKTTVANKGISAIPVVNGQGVYDVGGNAIAYSIPTPAPTTTNYRRLYTNGLGLADSSTVPADAPAGAAQIHSIPIMFFTDTPGSYDFEIKFAHEVAGGVRVRNRRLDVITFAES